MKTYTIMGWHGHIKDPVKIKLLNEISTMVETDYTWEFTGTLGEFSDKYPYNILFIPDSRIIGITDYNNFNSR